ncbi:MAG TPA: tryptophan dimethylallyltransferase family protein [Sorangium sp.]|nr:tryptophan dimethylallyltransferase family protein [Sorangium sp.]
MDRDGRVSDQGETPVASRSRAGIAARSYEEHGVEGITALSRAAGIPPEDNPLIPIFRRMVQPWGSRAIGERPLRWSDASNDGTPYEYSVAFGAHLPEMRFMVEAQGEAPDLCSNQHAGRALSERLGRELGVPLDRARRIEDLFLPREPRGIFAAWHAVAWKPGSAPAFKVYYNLLAQGPEASAQLLEEALTRLGLAPSYRAYCRDASGRGPELDQPIYFSLDLASGPEARVKVYRRHRGATAADIEAACAAAPSHRPGDGAALCRIAGGGDGPFDRRPPITCLSFVEGETAPSAVTVHFPICAYADDDSVAYDRIRALLVSHGLQTAHYESMLRAFASRPLAAGNGLQSYASLRRYRGTPRVTVYLGPEAYSPVVARVPQA